MCPRNFEKFLTVITVAVLGRAIMNFTCIIIYLIFPSVNSVQESRTVRHCAVSSLPSNPNLSSLFYTCFLYVRPAARLFVLFCISLSLSHFLSLCFSLLATVLAFIRIITLFSFSLSPPFLSRDPCLFLNSSYISKIMKLSR